MIWSQMCIRNLARQHQLILYLLNVSRQHLRWKWTLHWKEVPTSGRRQYQLCTRGAEFTKNMVPFTHANT